MTRAYVAIAGLVNVLNVIAFTIIEFSSVIRAAGVHVGLPVKNRNVFDNGASKGGATCSLSWYADEGVVPKEKPGFVFDFIGGNSGEIIFHEVSFL